MNSCPRLVGDAGKLGVALAAVHVANIEETAGVIGVEVNGVAGTNIAAIDVTAERALAKQGGKNLAFRGAGEGAAKRHQVPRELISVFCRSVPRVTAGPGKMFDHLNMGFGAFAPFS